MPRINIQVVGFVEVEWTGSAGSPADEPSGLWQDLRRVGWESTLPARPSRWTHRSEAARLGPVLYADLPRLSRELDAELGCLFDRVAAAR